MTEVNHQWVRSDLANSGSTVKRPNPEGYAKNNMEVKNTRPDESRLASVFNFGFRKLPGLNSRFSGYTLAILPIVAAGIVLLEYYRPSICGIVLVVLQLIYFFVDRRGHGRWESLNAIDWSVLLVVAIEVPSLAMSHYWINSIDWSEGLLSTALLYFLVRATLRSQTQAVSISILLAAFGVWISCSALAKFGSQLDSLRVAGFVGLVPFREKLTMGNGFIAGEWSTIVLLLLPFALILLALAFSAREYLAGSLAVIPAAIIAMELFATCSRGVVLGLVAGMFTLPIIAIGYRLIEWRKGVALLAGLLAALALILLIGNATFPGLASCYFGRDSSQVRSTEGRVAIWHSVMEAAQGSRMWGAGSGNSGFLLASHADESTGTAFAARTFSLPVEILVEKGIVGATCYGLLLLAILWELHATLRISTLNHSVRWIAVVAFSGIVMGLVRDLSYSSLAAQRVTLAIFAFLIAIISTARELEFPEPVGVRAKHRRKRL